MRSKFINWIKEKYDVTLTNNTHMFDIGFIHSSSRDGYDLYLIVNDKFRLEYGMDESVIQEEHNLFGIIREEIEDRRAGIIYLDNLEEWIDYLAGEFFDFDRYEDQYEDEDEDEE